MKINVCMNDLMYQSNDLDWGHQEHSGELGYCHVCGLEKYQICFHSRLDYVNVVSELIFTDPSGAYTYCQQMYGDVLETLRHLPEKHDLARRPPHTFFSKKYNNWLQSLKD